MIDDGTSWCGYLPLAKSLRARPDLVLRYADPRMEQKRLDAIRWLRMNGLWLCDRFVRRKT